MRDAARVDYCYACGTPWRDDQVVCACGRSDRAHGEARPSVILPNDVQTYPGPWRMIPWPVQTAIAMRGGPGAGKSTLCAILKPPTWITKEQEPKPVAEMFRRVVPGFMPRIVTANDPEDVARALSTVSEGPVVLDSLTAFGLVEALAIAHLMVNWTRRNNERSVSVLQLTKGGEGAGYNEIPHLYDVILSVDTDPQGARLMRTPKSRVSALESAYWSFQGDGSIGIPSFHLRGSYSVEGKPGNYWLKPHGMRGGEWAGGLAALHAVRALPVGIASAALPASYLPSGFFEPLDVQERRMFAERCGLVFLDADAIRARIDEAEAAAKESGADDADDADGPNGTNETPRRPRRPTKKKSTNGDGPTPFDAPVDEAHSPEND